MPILKHFLLVSVVSYLQKCALFLSLLADALFPLFSYGECCFSIGLMRVPSPISPLPPGTFKQVELRGALVLAC